MTRRKANPMSRSECARLAGLATAKSPRRFCFFRDGPRDAIEAVYDRSAVKTPEEIERLRQMCRNMTGRKFATRRKQWKMLTK